MAMKNPPHPGRSDSLQLADLRLKPASLPLTPVNFRETVANMRSQWHTLFDSPMVNAPTAPFAAAM